jgi:hypothetical protein
MKEHIIGIVNGTTKCERHKIYTDTEVSDRIRRCEFGFRNVGPHVLEHQFKLSKMLENLCPNYIILNFRNYVYDVLYPEAVVWGLQRLYNINYSLAYEKYINGFERSAEELASTLGKNNHHGRMNTCHKF